MTKPARRRWADIVAIFAGVWAFGSALWGPLIFSAHPRGPGAAYTWLAFGLGGLTAILGVFVAQQRQTAGRVLVGLAGLAQFIPPFTFVEPSALPIVSSVLIGIALLVAAPFVGPMPREAAKDDEQRNVARSRG